MKRIILPLTVALLAVPGLAIAKNDHGNKGKSFRGHQAVHASAGCPPGLAKKSPACVPPGLAKKQVRGDDHRHDHDHVIRVGEYLDPAYYGDRYVLVRDPGRYGLDPYGTYYRIDGNVFQVNRETQEVLALIGAVSAILN